MLRNIFLFLAMISTSTHAQIIAGFGGNRNTPIHINAEELSLNYLAQEALFSGNVVVKQSRLTMKSRYMSVLYTQDSTPQIKFLYASGDVWLIGQPTKKNNTPIARGKLAEYNVNTRKLILSGDVTLIYGENILKGQSLVIDLVSGKSLLDSTKEGKSGRVRGRFKKSIKTNESK